MTNDKLGWNTIFGATAGVGLGLFGLVAEKMAATPESLEAAGKDYALAVSAYAKAGKAHNKLIVESWKRLSRSEVETIGQTRAYFVSAAKLKKAVAEVDVQQKRFDRIREYLGEKFAEHGPAMSANGEKSWCSTSSRRKSWTR